MFKINIERIFSQDRVTKAVLGVSKDEFERLLPIFGNCLIAHRLEIKPNRMRKLGAGQKGDLPTNQDKLVYILLYLKLYPTYDALSVLTDHCRSKCGDSVKLLLPVLEKTLGRTLSLPARDGYKLEEILRNNPDLKDVFIDGTERKVQKPKKLKKRNRLYSGKKKATTRKTVIVSDEKKRILYMSKTKSGRRHDKRLEDKEHIFSHIPEKITAWTDTGFQGVTSHHKNTIMPTKATKKSPLSQEQKDNNKLISSIRVVSEHAIAGLKRFKAASDIYRNKLPNMDDQLTKVSIGLWNFHIQYA